MTLSSVLFIPHGAGPMPLLGDSDHQELVDFLEVIPRRLEDPAAICLISAHWEETIATVTSGASPQLIYDYYGFPDGAYSIQYPVPGSPELANKIFALLKQSGIDARLDDRRGFDHGLFVPLKLMYPSAQIPCVQISLLSHLDPSAHINLGKALRPLREENILFIGSGFSFHNMQAFLTGNQATDNKNLAFENWLIDTCTNKNLSNNEREARLIHWKKAPYACYCHPREEHLLPLHICAGIGYDAAELVFAGKVLGKRTCAFLW